MPLPPTFFGKNSEIDNSILTTGCEIYGLVVHSVIGEGVAVGEGTVIENSVIMNNSKIGKNVKMRYGMIDECVEIGDKAEIGNENSDRNSIVLIGRGNKIAKGAKVAPGEIVD